MARYIDSLPEPERILEKKVIVLSRSRIGTFSMYQAFQILGYKPYHIYECLQQGPSHVTMLQEALKAKYMGEGEPYTKADFDKWLADYDVLIEISQFFPEELIRFYPDAKFLITERSTESWVKSVQAVHKIAYESMHTFPLNIVRKMDDFVGGFADLTDLLAVIFHHGKDPADGMGDAIRDTIKITEMARRLVPADQLLVCKLEDGFGWEEICPFVGVDIPETKYPRGNAPAEMEKAFIEVMGPRIRNAALKILTGVLVPVVGVAAWFYMRQP